MFLKTENYSMRINKSVWCCSLIIVFKNKVKKI